MSKNTLAAVGAAILFTPILFSRISNPVVLDASETPSDDLSSLYRVWQTQKFLNKYGSPLESSSRKFVEVAERYNLDWRLLTAISGIESTFGKYIPSNSFNPFGFANGQAQFRSFDESIEVVGRYLLGMKKKGIDNVEVLGPIYTPPNFRNWISAVNFFMEELNDIQP